MANSIDLIQDPEQFPDFDDDFWKSVDSRENKSALVFFILNKIRGMNPEQMNEAQLRSAVGELKAYQKQLDLKPVIEKFKKEIEAEDLYQDEV